jgi:hypothetical protein
MSVHFQLGLKKSNGNLHITPKGDFDGSSACELVNLLHDQYDGNGCVVIETDDLRDVCPFGCNTFQCKLNRNILPADRLFFKGGNALKIAPYGSKVIENRNRRRYPCMNNCRKLESLKKGKNHC